MAITLPGTCSGGFGLSGDVLAMAVGEPDGEVRVEGNGNMSVTGLARITTVNRLRSTHPLRLRRHHPWVGSRRSARPAGAGTSGKRRSSTTTRTAGTWTLRAALR